MKTFAMPRIAGQVPTTRERRAGGTVPGGDRNRKTSPNLTNLPNHAKTNVAADAWLHAASVVSTGRRDE